MASCRAPMRRQFGGRASQLKSASPKLSARSDQKITQKPLLRSQHPLILDLEDRALEHDGIPLTIKGTDTVWRTKGEMIPFAIEPLLERPVGTPWIIRGC